MRRYSIRRLPWAYVVCSLLIAVGLLGAVSRPILWIYVALAIGIVVASASDPRTQESDTLDPRDGGAPAQGTSNAADETAGAGDQEPLRARDVILGLLGLLAALAVGLLLVAVIVTGAMLLSGFPKGLAVAPSAAVQERLSAETQKSLRLAQGAFESAVPPSVDGNYTVNVAFDKKTDTWGIAPGIQVRMTTANDAREIRERLKSANWKESDDSPHRDASGIDYLVFHGPTSSPIDAATPSLLHWTPSTSLSLGERLSNEFPASSKSEIRVKAPDDLVWDTQPDALRTEPADDPGATITVIPLHSESSRITIQLVGAPLTWIPSWIPTWVRDNLLGILLPSGVLGALYTRVKSRRKTTSSKVSPADAAPASTGTLQDPSTEPSTVENVEPEAGGAAPSAVAAPTAERDPPAEAESVPTQSARRSATSEEAHITGTADPSESEAPSRAAPRAPRR